MTSEASHLKEKEDSLFFQGGLACACSALYDVGDEAGETVSPSSEESFCMFSRQRVGQLLACSILDTIANREGKPQQRLEARQLKDTIRGGYTRVRQPYVRKAPMRRIRRQRNERPRPSRSFP